MTRRKIQKETLTAEPFEAEVAPACQGTLPYSEWDCEFLQMCAIRPD